MNIQQLQAIIQKHQEFHARKHVENKSGKNSIVRLGRLMTLNGLIMDLTIKLNDMLLDELYTEVVEGTSPSVTCGSKPLKGSDNHGYSTNNLSWKQNNETTRQIPQKEIQARSTFT